jgi:hypothetical protein
MTTADKIRRLLAEGKTAKEIAKKLKIKSAYVHTIKWQDKKASDFVSKVFEKAAKAKKTPFKVDLKAQKWKGQNPWFGVDKKKTIKALGLHESLVQQGVDPRSDEYWRLVDIGMKNRTVKKPTKLLIQPKHLKPALKLLNESQNTELKLPHPITTPEKMFHDIEDEQAKQEYRVRESLKEWHKEMRSKKPNNWVELPKDHIVGADLVNNPPHYTTGGIDFLDYAEAKGLTENAYLFNVVKYVSRAGKKVGSDPLEDLRKAEFYLKREIAVRERA